MTAIINVDEIKASKQIKNMISEQQHRIWKLEQALDDLNRATEIAQYSGQFEVIGVYRTEAETLLKDRLQLPDPDTSIGEQKIRIITGEVSEDNQKALNDQITAKAKVAAGVKV